MNVLKLIPILVFLLVVSLPLYARDTSSGCGVGWEINGDNSFLGTSLRGTTHATLVPTFSMTFGTSGCARHSVVKEEFRGIHYAEGNFSSLMVEMSLGQGEVLSGFAVVLGCGSVGEAFGQTMQEHYGNIFTSGEVTPVDMYRNVIHQIKTDSRLAGGCTLS